jgi:hypothetical protein
MQPMNTADDLRELRHTHVELTVSREITRWSLFSKLILLSFDQSRYTFTSNMHNASSRSARLLPAYGKRSTGEVAFQGAEGGLV